MNEVLLCETLGEDTTTQLWRDGDGGYFVRVMALPEDGGEQLPAHRSPLVYQQQPVVEWEARMIFGGSHAQRYVEAEQAFA